jgi:hypothetical protein
MSQYGTGLARSTIGRTTKVPGQVFPARAPLGEQVAPLHGVMTGLANLVNEHLSRLTIGPQATRFLRHLERQTFGNAGLHRRGAQRSRSVVPVRDYGVGGGPGRERERSDAPACTPGRGGHHLVHT